MLLVSILIDETKILMYWGRVMQSVSIVRAILEIVQTSTYTSQHNEYAGCLSPYNHLDRLASSEKRISLVFSPGEKQPRFAFHARILNCKIE